MGEIMMNVNFLSQIALIKGFLPRFKNLKNKGGAQIVNVSSIVGLFGTPLRSYYCMSKFAIDGFGKALEAELVEDNIHVCQCYPAYVRTNCAKFALVGSGVPIGKQEGKILNQISAEDAAIDLIKAMYVKRSWITLEGGYYWTVYLRLQLLIGEMYNKHQYTQKYRLYKEG